MERFWNWLAQANARRVYGTALVILALSTAYWTWRAYRPVAADLLPPTSGLAQSTPRAELGLLAMLEAEFSQGVRVPDNLFLYSPGPRKPALVIKPKPPPRPPSHRPPEPPPPPPRDIVTLVYRGLFQRTDGRALALVEDSKTRSSSFYASGTKVFGVTVGAIRMDHLVVTDATGVPVTLRLKQPVSFEEGRYVR